MVLIFPDCRGDGHAAPFGSRPWQLFFIGLLPAVLAYTVNSFLLSIDRTVFKSLIVNLSFLLITFFATVWISSYFSYLYLPGDIFQWKAGLVPFIWQLFSWLSGAFFPAAFAAGEGGRPIPIKVLEGSLLLAGPAVFLLA
ncbi:MAG: hypothetical protein GX767_04290, partial [Firmicutes bacterium]|nr:hypothetical protein [Bacillota bacterium]